MVERNFRFAVTVADRHYVMEGGRVIDHPLAEDVPGSMDRFTEQLGV